MGAFRDLANKNKGATSQGAAPSLKSTNFSTRSVVPADELPAELPLSPSLSRSPINGAVEMDDQMGTPLPVSDHPFQDIIASGATKVAGLPVIKQSLSGLGHAIDFVENLPGIKQLGGALAGGYNTIVEAPSASFPDWNAQAKKNLSDFVNPSEANPEDAIFKSIENMIAGAKNPDEAKAKQADIINGRTQGMGPLSKFGYSTLTQTATDPLSLIPVAGVGRVSKLANVSGDLTKSPVKTLRELADRPIINIDETLNSVQEANARNLDENDALLRSSLAIEKPLPKSTIDNALSDTVRPIEEPPTQALRANFKNQLENGKFSDELQQHINNTDQTYERISNAESVAKANENVKNLSEAESNFLLNEKGGADHVATGYRLLQELDALGEHKRALVIANKLAQDLTKSGQTSQAASILERLSPEGQLLNLVRTAERNGKEVSTADSVKYKELAKDVQKKSGAGIRANEFNNVLDKLSRGETPTPEDLQKLSKYLSDSKDVAKPKKIIVKDELPEALKEPKKREKVVSYMSKLEEEALARIAKRKNSLNSLPIDEWADHAIVVASQIAKGTIKAATHVEDLVKLFGESIRPVASEVFQQAQKVLQSSSEKAVSENIPLAEKIVEKYLKTNTKVDQKDIDMLRNLAKDITKLSGAKKVNADMEMQKILNSYEKSTVWGKVQAIRYISMLLNSSTQAVNAISGPIMATTGYVSDILPTMVDSLMHKALKTPRTTTLYGSNPLQFMARYFKNAKVGAIAGWHGVNPSGIQGTNEIRGLTFKSPYNPLGIAERSLGAVAKGADYATYQSVFDSEMVKQGYLDAVNKGIKGSKEIKAHIEQFKNNPPEEAILQADRIGKNTTFQRSDTTGGKVANYLNSAPKILEGPIRSVFPFVRTPVNIASTAVTLTPGGIIKGLYQLTSKSDASRREAIRTLSMGLTGTGIGAVGYYLSQLGIVTGANDSGDSDVNAIREQAGQGKYRFNTSALSRYIEAMINGEGAEAAEKAAQYQKGDKQFDYNKLQPLAFPLAIGASVGNNKDQDLSTQISKAGEDAYGSLYGMSTLKGVQDVFQPSFGGTLGEKALGVPSRIAESFFKSFSPSALGQEARRQDPIQRKTPFNDGLIPDVKAYFKSRTPGLSQSLPPNKTTLGQNKLNSDGVVGQYANPYKSDVAPYNDAAKIITELMDKTGDFSISPSAPDKKVEGKDANSKLHVSLSIPQKRYDQLQEEVGNEIIQKVTTLDPKLSDSEKIEAIKKIYSKAKETGRNKVKKELGIMVN